MDDTARIAQPQYAGFSPRLAAIVLDMLILSAICRVLELLIFDALAALGNHGPIAGFLISVTYFGMLNGRLGNGQTLGKRWMGLRVVGADGHPPKLAVSTLRAAIYAMPLLATGIAPILGDAGLSASTGMGVLISGPALVSAYLFIFNRPSRRVLHDLIARTCVMRAGSNAEIATLSPLGRTHPIALASLLVVFLALPLLVDRIAQLPPFHDLLVVQHELLRLDGVQEATVKSTLVVTASPATVAIIVDLRVTKAELHNAWLAEKAAQTVLDHFPAATAASSIIVKLSWGYDLGFVNSLRAISHSYLPAELAVARKTSIPSAKP